MQHTTQTTRVQLSAVSVGFPLFMKEELDPVMMGIHRRKRVEGWTVNVSEAESMGAPSTLRQKLGEDNRLWLLAAGVVIILTFWLITHPTPGGTVAKDVELQSINGSYDDQNHQDFVTQFMNRKSISANIIECRFAGPGLFHIIMAKTVSADDIEYTARMAAQRIEIKLKERPIVVSYLQNTPTGQSTKAAETKWNSNKNGYLTKFAENPTE